MNDRDTTPAVGAVVVTFQPEPGQVEALLDTLASELDTVVLVDNSVPKIELARTGWSEASLKILRPRGNIGVAAAINRGVEHLRRLGARYALLLDQDSSPTAGMTAGLVSELVRLEGGDQVVAAIGPQIRDRDRGRLAPFVRFRLPFNQHLEGNRGSVACDFLISSGTLLNLRHWEQVGPMREAWFIDSIDMEWCFRARRSGLAIVGCFDACLDHSIGQSRRLLPARWSPHYRHHGSARLYTMMRNRIFLYRSGAPPAWIVQDLLRSIGKLLLFSVLVSPRRANLAAMVRGLRDGVTTRPVP